MLQMFIKKQTLVVCHTFHVICKMLSLELLDVCMQYLVYMKHKKTCAVFKKKVFLLSYV